MYKIEVLNVNTGEHAVMVSENVVIAGVNKDGDLLGAQIYDGLKDLSENDRRRVMMSLISNYSNIMLGERLNEETYAESLAIAPKLERVGEVEEENDVTFDELIDSLGDDEIVKINLEEGTVEVMDEATALMDIIGKIVDEDHSCFGCPTLQECVEEGLFEEEISEFMEENAEMGLVETTMFDEEPPTELTNDMKSEIARRAIQEVLGLTDEDMHGDTLHTWIFNDMIEDLEVVILHEESDTLFHFMFHDAKTIELVSVVKNFSIKVIPMDADLEQLQNGDGVDVPNFFKQMFFLDELAVRMHEAIESEDQDAINGVLEDLIANAVEIGERELAEQE